MPTAADVMKIHEDLTKLFEGENDPISPPGVKNRELLESACSRPSISLDGKEKYESLVMKLGALTHSITKNHAFHNGNKRAALATLLTTLHRNSCCLKPSVTDDNVFDFIVGVTADEFPKRNHSLHVDRVIWEIAWWIRKNTEALQRIGGSIKVSEFIKKCEMAGMHYKSANGSHIISNPKASAQGKQKSVKFSMSTPQLSGQTAASYVRRLGLSARNSGIDSNEFYDGARIERAAIHRFIVALRRLART